MPPSLFLTTTARRPVAIPLDDLICFEAADASASGTRLYTTAGIVRVLENVDRIEHLAALAVTHAGARPASPISRH